MAKKNQSTNSEPAATSIPKGIRFFAPKAGSSACLLADVEVPLYKGPLAGLKITGIKVWRKRSGENDLFVTFPARPDGEKSWEHLRASDSERSTVDAVKNGILAAYRALAGESVAEPIPTAEEYSAA